MQKPATPKLDALKALKPGIARDLFEQVNARALAFETQAVDAYEAATTTRDDAKQIERARREGGPELARYLELEQSNPTMAAIFRQSNAFAIAQQSRRLEPPTDDGPQAA